MASAKGSTRKARILVVDDHPMVREGLLRLINKQSDLVCCADAGTIAEAQTAVAEHKPDLVILDLRLKGEDGLELLKSLKTKYSDLGILILSQYDAPVYAERALRAGALGYVVKEQAAEEVLDAIRFVLTGEVYLPRAMAALLLHQFVGGAPKSPRVGVEHLTDRELHVLRLLGTGLSTRAIATELRLSFSTIEAHRENIKHKLGLQSATELIHYATEFALRPVMPPPEATKPLPKRLNP